MIWIDIDMTAPQSMKDISTLCERRNTIAILGATNKTSKKYCAMSFSPHSLVMLNEWNRLILYSPIVILNCTKSDWQKSEYFLHCFWCFLFQLALNVEQILLR